MSDFIGGASITWWFPAIGTAVGAVWALITFRRNNRIKAAEILIGLENAYSSHIPTLLEIEHMSDYLRVYRKALIIAVRDGDQIFTRSQSGAIDRLEAALRHFYVCAAVQRLSVDAGAIDKLCSWYLRVLVTETDVEGNLKRPELREYIRKYWPTLYFWAPLAAQPWPRRAWIYALQIPARIEAWWNPPTGHRTPLGIKESSLGITRTAARPAPVSTS